MRATIIFVAVAVFQSTAVGLDVTVVNPKGLPVKDARVFLVDAASHTQLSAITDNEGKAAFGAPNVNSATIFCAHPEYRAFVKKSHPSDKPLQIHLKQRKNSGSVVFPTGRGEIPGLSGFVTIIIDRENQLHIFSDKIVLNDGRKQLLEGSFGQTIQATDSGGNRSEVQIIAAEGRVALIEFQDIPKQIAVPAGAVLVTDLTGRPIPSVDVYFVHPVRKTQLSGKTDKDGVVTIAVGDRTHVTVFAAHPKYRAYRKVAYIPGESLHIELISERQIGSLVCDGTGQVPGLNGRLNPILDNLKRLYMYADNIALDGGKQQPVIFRLGKPISAADSNGSQFHLVVVDIIGKTSLIRGIYLTQPTTTCSVGA